MVLTSSVPSVINNDMEQIKEIPGFKGYFASSEGNIYSSWTNHGINNGKRKILHPFTHKNGYKFLSLKIADSTYYHASVHRLVCMAFYGIPEDPKTTASHIDGDKNNNKVENLCWESLSDNDKRKIEHGRYDGGYLNSRAKIDKEALYKIRELLKTGEMTHENIGKLFGVNRVFITKIKNGNRYANV